MAKINTFKDLIVWRKAHELVLFVYKATKDFPDEEKYNLVNQMRRCSTSVVSNIVEGFRRKGLKDSLNFYNRADSSLEELKYQILLSFDLEYLSREVYIKANQSSEEVSKLLFSWIKSQKNNALKKK